MGGEWPAGCYFSGNLAGKCLGVRRGAVWRKHSPSFPSYPIGFRFTKTQPTLVFFPGPVMNGSNYLCGALCESRGNSGSPLLAILSNVCVCVSPTTIEGWKIDHNYIPAGFWRLDRQLERNLPCSCQDKRVAKRWAWKEGERACQEKREQYKMDSVHFQRHIFKRPGLLN